MFIIKVFKFIYSFSQYQKTMDHHFLKVYFRLNFNYFTILTIIIIIK
jgi:hypothetical protein